MAFKDLDLTLFEGGFKELPIGGKKYRFPGSVSARTGLLIHRMLITAEQAASRINAGEHLDLEADMLADVPEGEDDIRSEILGDAEYDLIEDGVSLAVVDHVYRTLMFWHAMGEEVALQIWEATPGAPKAPQDRRPKSRQGTSASASTTQKRASTTRTAKSAPAPRGSRSSTTGA